MTTPAKKSAFQDIDLDITHYDADELLAMLNSWEDCGGSRTTVSSGVPAALSR